MLRQIASNREWIKTFRQTNPLFQKNSHQEESIFENESSVKATKTNKQSTAQKLRSMCAQLYTITIIVAQTKIFYFRIQDEKMPVVQDNKKT